MPGQVFPADRARSTDSHAERLVYDALKRQLPDGWRAWHSVKLRARGGKWEGEGDFVVAIPGKGILVLEVKGGRVELRDGHWLQNGHPMGKAPRDQGQTFARNLVTEIERRGGGKVPFGVACAFPEVEFGAGPQTGDLKGAVLGALQLKYLAESLPLVAKELVPAWAVPEDARWIPAIDALWGAIWVGRVRLRDRADDLFRQRVALDDEQLELLDLAGENPRALVEGVAGTGKTVVARELCLRRAQAGERVLYLCFTEALANAIEQQFRETGLPPERLSAMAIRQYARALVGEEGPPPSAESQTFWEQIPLRAIDRLPVQAERPACTVIDEAQDLAPADWKLIEALVGARALWVFQDPRQSFWRERQLPEWVRAMGARLRLKKQQRSPPAVSAAAELFAGNAVPVIADPQALQVIVGEDLDLLDRVTATLDQLVAEGVRHEEIAVLSLGGQRRSVLQHLDRIGEHPLVRADSPDASRAVVADTFLRFKGLERPFIVIAELEGGRDHRFATRMHIALTRATTGVRILCARADLDGDERLHALSAG